MERNKNNIWDVVVIGGGPAGSFFAIKYYEGSHSGEEKEINDGECFEDGIRGGPGRGGQSQ